MQLTALNHFVGLSLFSEPIALIEETSRQLPFVVKPAPLGEGEIVKRAVSLKRNTEFALLVGVRPQPELEGLMHLAGAADAGYDCVREQILHKTPHFARRYFKAGEDVPDELVSPALAKYAVSEGDRDASTAQRSAKIKRKYGAAKFKKFK